MRKRLECSLSSLEDHGHAVSRTQSDVWIKHNSVSRQNAHVPFARQGADNQYALRPRESFADALQRAAAKWKIGELRTARCCFRRPTLGIEPLRVREIARVAMHYERTKVHV